ncbi:pilus assembly FimT family protein [Cerasicoccus maritimus]|uniref:pilus assembly FimT family protein n=1 Tax=Cerasicoccus maritimus TaxID=490089 RepID=UPI0028524D04|nr:type II secretion system protein [Cerasicoccus maritimus]
MTRHSGPGVDFSDDGWRGFTLLEVIFVLALITLMAGVVASFNLDSILKSNGAKPAYEVFREATHEARIKAINDASVVFLSYDAETQQFRLRTDADSITAAEEADRALPTFNRYGYLDEAPEEESAPPRTDSAPTMFQVYEDELTVEIRGIRAENTGVALSSSEYSSEPLPYLTFHPSGVSTPAIVTLRNADGDETTLTLDTFSNGPQLSRDERVGY